MLATMMNNHTKRNNQRRQPAGRSDRRAIYSPDRGGRTNRGPPVERTQLTDGVYKNQRFTHVFISLVGCVVQVQVKKGIIYEGILKTSSPKMDIVLELAHMVEDSSSSVSSVPSRDRLIDKLIIKLADVVTIHVANIDLDYAVKDTFTDTAISKYNGETKEKDLKELQPWEAEGATGDLAGGLEGDKSNGWDPNEMFRTNREQFNVHTSYDDSLAQYTTKLEKKNTDEYKQREQQALKLAAEIECSEQYKKHIALENGEGDEEELFSSVVRPNESNPGTSGKYVPPNRRPHQGAKGTRGGYNQGHMNRSSPPHQGKPEGPPPPMQSQQQSQVSQQQNIPVSSSSLPDIAQVNGDPAVPVGGSASSTSAVKPSQDQSPGASSSDKSDPSSPNSSKGGDKRKNNVKAGRDAQIKELKEFSSKFKLDDPREKEFEKDRMVEKEQSPREKPVPSPQEMAMSDSKRPEMLHRKPEESSSNPHVPQVEGQDRPKDAEAAGSGSKSAFDETVMKSTLNPNAKEFVFNPQKSFQPKHTTQIPTPPRAPTPHTSPIVPMMAAQPVYPSPGQQYIMPPVVVAPTNQQHPRAKKAAVVSVRPDYSAAAAQAATGQPLLAQSGTPQQSYVYMPHVIPQQAANFPMSNMQQMISMPSTNQPGPRYMNPSQQMAQTSLPTPVEQSNQPHSGQFVHNQQPTGPMPAHMNVPQATHLNPPNISHHPMPNPQPSQMNPPPPSGAPHAAPSPVHNTGPNPPQPQHQGHPPSSGTPQPPQVYPQVGMQNHPPSPHNPTSPQSMQPMPYQYNNAHTHPMQMQAASQFSLQQQSNVPTSVTYSMQAHGHSHVPQFVMMSHHHNTGQMHPHIQHNTQYPGHHMSGPGGPVHSQAQMLQQGGVQGMPGGNHNQGAPHPTHIQPFIPQVHSQGGQPVQNYQQQQ